MEPVNIIDKRRFTPAGCSEADGVEGKPLSLDDEAKEVMDDLVKRHGVLLSSEEYDASLAEVRQQLVQQRVLYRAMLQRAQSELNAVSFRQLRAAELKTVKGVRQKYIIALGRFVYGRGGEWLFEASNEETLQKAMRFSRLKDASHRGLLLHKELLKTCEFDEDGKVKAEGWKAEMTRNIAEELATLEVE